MLFPNAFCRLFEDDHELFRLPPDSPRGPRTLVTNNFDLFRYPLFKKDQPMIGAYAQSSPENMAKLFCFVFCSIQTEWPRLMALFPIMWDKLVTTGTAFFKTDRAAHDDGDGFKLKYVEPKEDSTDFDMAMSWWRPQAQNIDNVWRQRRAIYTSVMHAVEEDARNGDTGFLVYLKLAKLRGLGAAKAGFATQLLIGKVGCVDSVNLNILGHEVPTDIRNKDGKGFKTASGIDVKNSGSKIGGSDKYQHLSKILKGDRLALLKFLHGALNSKSYDILRKYADYLDKIAEEGTTSETLWNVWCAVTAHRIRNFNGKPLDIQFPNQIGMTRMGAYKNSIVRHLTPAQKRLRGLDNTQMAASVSDDHVRSIRENLLEAIERMLAEE